MSIQKFKLNLRVPNTLALLALLITAFAAGVSFQSTSDADIWWHLKTGEWIVTHGAVPWHDPFGANTAGNSWIEYSWLADVVFHLIDRLDPAFGLKLLQGLVAALTIGLLYLHARLASGRPHLALLLAGLAAVPLLPWYTRPQMFSFLFTAATLLLLWWAGHRSRRAYWLLPPIMALWANLHIYFVVGLGLMWLVLLWPWLEWAARDRRPDHRPDPAGLAAAAIATLAPLLTPYGVALYQDVLHLAQHASFNWPVGVIKELQSPDFHNYVGKALFAWIVLFMLVFSGLGRSPPPLTLFLFLALLFRALTTARDIPYLVIVMVPLAAAHIAAARPSAGIGPDTPPTPAGRNAAVPWLTALLLAMLAALLLANSARDRDKLIQQREHGYPAGAVTYLLNHRPPGPLLNEFDWGGYLIHKLHPAYKVYLDGRNQLYPRAFWEEYDKLSRCAPGWQARLEATHARIVLWDKDEPLAALLRLAPGWSIAYEGDEAVLFEKREE